MNEETEGNGLIIGGVVLVAVGFLCVGLVVLGYLFFGISARPAYSLKKSAHSLANPPTQNLNGPETLTKEESKKVIEAAIRKELKNSTGELTEADLEKVTELNLNSNQLTAVEGLEKLTQLKQLYLGDNRLTDVRSLEKLTQLTYLNLNTNQLTDVKGLEKLTQLTWLKLEDNPALTKAQINALQKALPKCRIQHNPTK